MFLIYRDSVGKMLQDLQFSLVVIVAQIKHVAVHFITVITYII